jgi:hypothetical protein
VSIERNYKNEEMRDEVRNIVSIFTLPVTSQGLDVSLQNGGVAYMRMLTGLSRDCRMTGENGRRG